MNGLPEEKGRHLREVTPQAADQTRGCRGGVPGATHFFSNVPPGKKAPPCRATLRKLLLRRGYHFSLALQPFTERSGVRHCVACGGRSTLTGPVWCSECAGRLEDL
jgi:hypothetical protein